jgi:hypothetical protein
MLGNDEGCATAGEKVRFLAVKVLLRGYGASTRPLSAGQEAG